MRYPIIAEGRLLRERIHRGRLVLDAPAARCGGSHHAVQLPGDGAAVVRPAGDRMRQHRSAQAQREGPERGQPDGIVVHRGRPARRRVQRGARRQGGGRRASDAPDCQGRIVRRLDPDRALHIRDRYGQRQAGAGTRRGEEPHGRPARRRPGSGRRRRGQRGLRLGGGAVHGHLGGAGGRPDRRRAGGQDRRTRRAAHHRAG